MKIRLLTLIACTLGFFSQAQVLCGFDDLNKTLLKNPKNAQAFAATEQSIQNYINTHKNSLLAGSTTTYTIPVVVHVMHTGGAIGSLYNPSDATIQGAINYLNQVYAGTYAGMEQPVEGGGIVSMPLQFVFAQRTPSCGATNGIDRVDASSITNYAAHGVNYNGTTGCTDLDVKNFARWNTADYYNIWIVNKIDDKDGTSGQFIAGYAYFAGSSASLDGTVMLATQMMAGQKTLPHEMGHAFNLYHPFEGSNLNTNCPANTTCSTDGDMVCDTDPITFNINGSGVYDFTCRTGTNTCTGAAYTVNTEHNFMSYTNCYSLFTNGQKARVVAAMSLPSRSGFATSLGAIPCGTGINFSTSAVTLTESNAGTTVGCRMYTDYTYQLTIGAAPTATATATLTYSGTATKGLDYDVTTNGSFTSPSNQVTFATGSTAAQNFTVRIYNDANVEAAETVVIDFTLNSNGGNAAKGTLSPTLSITINDNDAAPAAAFTSNYSIGNIAGFETDAPFAAGSSSQRSQYIYKASELTAAGLTAGNITALQLQVFGTSRPFFNNFTIKMANTSTNFLVEGGVATIINGMTQVYTNPLLTATDGWNNFTFSTPFLWDGTSNVAIEICYAAGTSGGGSGQVSFYNTPGASITQGSMIWQNNIDCNGSFSSITYYVTGVKPIIRLGLAVAGTPIETAASSTRTEYIDVGSADYFYSNNGKLMTKLSAVNAPLACVTTTIENEGTTWTGFGCGERSAKVFAVTPTTNATTASYTLSLYFTPAELAGKDPATLKIAKTSAANIAGATTANTIFITPTVSTLGVNSVFTGTFTGFSRYFLATPPAAAYVTVPIKIMLQGAYTSGPGMYSTLRSGGYIPLTQPYNSTYAGINYAANARMAYAGTETVTALPANAVDWVEVELRSAASAALATKATTVATRAGILLADGTIVDTTAGFATPLTFCGVATGNYYIVVHHRNHLGVMSAMPVTLSNTTQLYDFTTSMTQAYSSNAYPMVNVGGVYCLWSGDVNGNGRLTLSGANNDASLLSNYVTTYAGNTGQSTTFSAAFGYSGMDINMTGRAALSGAGNGAGKLNTIVTTFPLNVGGATNYNALTEQVP